MEGLIDPTEIFAEFIAIEGMSPRAKVFLDGIEAAAEAGLPAGDTEGLLRLLLSSDPSDNGYSLRQLQDWVWGRSLEAIDWAALPGRIRHFEEARVEGQENVG